MNYVQYHVRDICTCHLTQQLQTWHKLESCEYDWLSYQLYIRNLHVMYQHIVSTYYINLIFFSRFGPTTHQISTGDDLVFQEYPTPDRAGHSSRHLGAIIFRSSNSQSEWIKRVRKLFVWHSLTYWQLNMLDFVDMSVRACPRVWWQNMTKGFVLFNKVKFNLKQSIRSYFWATPP